MDCTNIYPIPIIARKFNICGINKDKDDIDIISNYVYTNDKN